ncbi:RlpA-like double-psi beta-barrel-protein domain-containing protein-containing protein [Mycena pura]|uniref:RlpA-like double-psi beta-barrel-protein domain-containing protein-containing protein n=1 Tax=Mycena pura TaxID=153505 RepID=A0AAD7E6S0_9AGAR|nr:RlpA-like double-psi beta-barrel-protein domain-containing protein-containing protein [Mycena pura]
MILQISAIAFVLGGTLRSARGAALHPRAAAGGYIQTPGPGTASFTMYSGCQQPACGVASTGFSAAINQLAFGSVPGLGPGDACGRCFALTGTSDPFSPAFTGPFGKSIVVKVTDMCPVQGNEQWCGQTATSDTNQFNMPVHFDICEDTGGAAQFFPSGHGALTGTWQEVSCSQWTGTDGGSLFNGSCIIGENAPFWPSVGCGNQGLAPDIRATRHDNRKGNNNWPDEHHDSEQASAEDKTGLGLRLALPHLTACQFRLLSIHNACEWG